VQQVDFSWPTELLEHGSQQGLLGQACGQAGIKIQPLHIVRFWQLCSQLKGLRPQLMIMCSAAGLPACFSARTSQPEHPDRMANPRFDWSEIKCCDVKISRPCLKWRPRSGRAHKLSIVVVTAFLLATSLHLVYLFLGEEVMRQPEFQQERVLTILARRNLPSPNTTCNGDPSNPSTYPAF
jgi:hypothetical protein